MARSTKKFYRKGVDNQKTADVIVDLRRPDDYIAKHWTVEQKIFLRSFINDAESSFKSFIEELKQFAT